MTRDKLTQLRNTIREYTHADEETCVRHLLQQTPLSECARKKITTKSAHWVDQCRTKSGKQRFLDAFLQEYSLSSQEGIALMRLAEALLRVPDSPTADKLIAEKIHTGIWSNHCGHSDKLFVNAATWGLILTGNIVHLDNALTNSPSHWLQKLIGRLGGPAVRFMVLQAMKLMGQQYVLGRTIEESIKRGLKESPSDTRFSFDMLGEGARTHQDADNYFEAYLDAIHEIGKRNNKNNIYQANGVSVKLSALHPRYQYSQYQCMMDEMLPRLLELAVTAKRYTIGFTIDAEEAARLELSLDLFQALAESPQLVGWNGLGLALQAYQKRALPIINWLTELATTTNRRLMIRLVKGAYWDTEIKHAQELGLPDYPVFTRKAHTDLSYQVCADRLLAHQKTIFPQFATHNAYTIATILELAGDADLEFQRLHGMGELLYGEVGRPLPLRVYAPVGTHSNLLPYLVRRLLENGANSSFVNQFLDKQVPSAEITYSAEDEIDRLAGFRHGKIPLPRDIYRYAGDARDNAKGIDLDDPIAWLKLNRGVEQARRRNWRAGPIVGGALLNTGTLHVLRSPANADIEVGRYTNASPTDINTALTLAVQAQPDWQDLGALKRAAILDQAATQLERHAAVLTGLISLEAGRTLNDGISEVREAVDFCRYYAAQIRTLATHGNQKLLQGRGVFACISPWNFPLAIFIGQSVAALAAGNAVIAKPAEQTPLIAAEAVKILHQAGVPKDVLHLITGIGSVIGPQLMADQRVSGVAFTGSTETALRIQSGLIKRGDTLPPLIAETGGQNAMLVDSTALPEQIVDDVIHSAFLSAGQRCSALRVLFLQEDIADQVIGMLKGALKTLFIGEPWRLESDLGPVIDNRAKQTLLDHIVHMEHEATFLGRADLPKRSPTKQCPTKQFPEGHYIAPHIYELDDIRQLQQEVFGPILHIVRYKTQDLDQVIQSINDTGYGLTLGIHSRITGFAESVFAKTRVGNTYVNRNMVGAVVGVNPFGGQGLSGTGFKAGGPHYLLRFTNLWPSAKINGRDTSINSQPGTTREQSIHRTLSAQWHWDRLGGAQRSERLAYALSNIPPQLISIVSKPVVVRCQALLNEARDQFTNSISLPGPTGETNALSLHGRGVFLVYLDSAIPAASIQQIFAALAAGNAVIIGATEQSTPMTIAHWLNSALPEKLLSVITNSKDISAMLLHEKLAGVAAHNNTAIAGQLSRRQGAIIPLVTHLDGPFALLPYAVEKTYTKNIAATGGNTLLLNLRE